MLHMFKRLLGLEFEEREASSDPTQALSLNPNPRSEDDRAHDNNRREAPTRALASGFFSGASGTTLSGPTHFASTSGPQVAVHIHQPSANLMNPGDQLNPTVLMLAAPTPPPFLPVNTMHVIPSNSSNMGTPYANESTVADVDPPKDNEIYERLLRRKQRGFALYIPQPNRRLPIAYQRMGIRIGDVGVVTADGGFSFLFNICVPHDDPINPSILPEDFSPLQPSLTDADVVEFPRFNSGSYLASASIEQKEIDSNAEGLHFETSASEGAVLTMPEGAISLDLENDLPFRNYLKTNVLKWYEFVCRGRSICNGQIRLVIGCDKTTAWGIATVSGISQQTTTRLKFKTLDTGTTTYSWECSGMVEVRVGPDRREIEALRYHDDGGQPLDTTLYNQCLFVRTMNATLSNDDWAKLMRNLGETTVEDLNTPSGTTLDPLLGSRPSGSNNTRSSNQLGSHQEAPGTQSYSMGRESAVTMSTTPDSFAPYHPSDDLNRQLLLKFPKCRMVITKDQDWLSTFKEDEEMVSDPEQLLERVLASHDVRIENGVLHLDWNKQETPRSISPSFLSDHILEGMPTKDNSHIHNFKGPRATITKKTIHPPLQTPSPRPDSLQPITEFAIGRPTSPIVKPSRSIVLYDANSKGVDHDLPPPIGERPPQSGLAIFWDRIAMTLRLRVRQPKLRKISVSSVAAK